MTLLNPFISFPAAGGVVTYRDHVLATVPNLVAYWPMDAGTSDLVNAANPGTYDLSVLGTVSTDAADGPTVPGLGCRNFPGAGGGLLRSTTLATTSGGMLLGCWIKPDIAHTNGGVMGKWAANSGPLIYLTATSKMTLQHNGVSASSANSTITTSAWQFVAAAFGPTSSPANDILGWINKTNAATRAGSTTVGTGATNFDLGAYQNGAAGTYFDGKMCHAFVSTMPASGTDSLAAIQAVVVALVDGP